MNGRSRLMHWRPRNTVPCIERHLGWLEWVLEFQTFVQEHSVTASWCSMERLKIRSSCNMKDKHSHRSHLADFEIALFASGVNQPRDALIPGN